MMQALRLLACLSILLGQPTVLAQNGAERGVRGLVDEDKGITAQGLLDHDWRLFSYVFPQLPEQGYEIAFGDDGVVQTRNLAGIERWELNDSGELVLSTADGAPRFRFAFDDCQNALAARTHEQPTAPKGIGFVLRLVGQPSIIEACRGLCSPTEAPFCCTPCQSTGESDP